MKIKIKKGTYYGDFNDAVDNMINNIKIRHDNTGHCYIDEVIEIELRKEGKKK